MEELMQKYYEMFGKHFPTMCFPRDLEGLMDKMKECISKRKPAEELFGLDYSNKY